MKPCVTCGGNCGQCGSTEGDILCMSADGRYVRAKVEWNRTKKRWERNFYDNVTGTPEVRFPPGYSGLAALGPPAPLSKKKSFLRRLFG